MNPEKTPTPALTPEQINGRVGAEVDHGTPLAFLIAIGGTLWRGGKVATDERFAVVRGSSAVPGSKAAAGETWLSWQTGQHYHSAHTVVFQDPRNPLVPGKIPGTDLECVESAEPPNQVLGYTFGGGRLLSAPALVEFAKRSYTRGAGR